MTPDPAALAAFEKWWSEWQQSKGVGTLYTWHGLSRGDVQNIWLAAWNASAQSEASDEDVAAAMEAALRSAAGEDPAAPRWRQHISLPTWRKALTALGLTIVRAGAR